MCASFAARRSTPTGGVVSRPPKKRLISNSPEDSKGADKEPIVFQSPGLKPDTRLTVLGQEFHVHSVILKLHSAFFRKFLDSADKEVAPTSSAFRYDYVSVFDADGTWGLEPASTAQATSTWEETLAKNPKAQATEIQPFEKLLCSMYTRPYVIEDVVELLAIIRLADFYCSLPNLSGTLSTALLSSPMFKRESCSNESAPEEPEPNEFVLRAGEIIFAAKKLRHPVLFRECFIHLVAKLHDEDFYWLDLSALRGDKDLWPLLNEAKSDLRQIILQAQHAVLLALLDGYLQTDLQMLMTDAFRENPEDSPFFYKRLLDLREQIRRGDYEEVDEMFAPIERLLRNNLALDQTGFGAGEGPYDGRFLCAELADENMPWDAAEYDWYHESACFAL